MLPNLRLAVTTHERLRAELVAQYPDLAEDGLMLADTLEGESALPDIIAAYLRSVLDDEAMIAGIDAQLKARSEPLLARKNRVETRKERKRALVLYAMQEGLIPKIVQSDFSASIGQQDKVIITDEEALASEYVRIKKEPNKIAIGKALRSGKTVDGATLSNPAPKLTIYPR